MPREFVFRDYRCQLSAGYPVAGSREQTEPSFIDELAAARGYPRNLSRKDRISWILSRLAELTLGGLPLEGTTFESDGGEFGYRIRIADAQGDLLGNWGIVFWPDRIQLSGFAVGDCDGQQIIVQMLTDSPQSLAKCEICIRNPETRSRKTYGWNGFQFV